MASRHKRLDPKVLTELRQKEKGAPEDLVAHALVAAGMALRTTAELARAAGVSLEQTEAALSKLSAAGTAASLTVEGNIYYLDGVTFRQTLERVQAALAAYHQKIPSEPERPGGSPGPFLPGRFPPVF